MTKNGEKYIKMDINFLHNMENYPKTFYFKFFTKLRKRVGKPSKILVNTTEATMDEFLIV